MNNEIGRKITSLTLMTIMVAGGMSFAIPGMEPAFAANANLFVSAENSQFDNYMSGPQVIEVVVIDSDIDDTDEAKGEPDVTINGKILRMVQAVDGNWYGYFADRTQASIADFVASGSTSGGSTRGGQSLDFGTLCPADDATAAVVGVDVSDTVGIAVPLFSVRGLGGANGTATGAALTTVCAVTTGGSINSATSDAGDQDARGANNVIRESKAINLTLTSGTGTGDDDGQIGINGTAVWPFVQLYPLNPTGNVVVQYNKGGGVQSTTLTFDTVDQFAGAVMDKSVYTRDAQVHVTITDLWLNIDPTDEDSWTFGTATGSTSSNYQVFDENGGSAGAGVVGGIINVQGNFSSMMIEDNGILILTPDAQTSGTNVLTLQDNDDSVLTCTTAQDAATCSGTGSAVDGLAAGTLPITITEQGPNSGVFGTYDESDVSVIIVTSDALRGTSATINYNETPVTVLAGFEFGTIDIQPIDDEWNSGEEIPVILVDGDANKNSRVDEDLDLNSPSVTLIPSLVTGDPFTLGESSNSTGPVAIYLQAEVSESTGIVSTDQSLKYVAANMTVDSFSQIGRVNSTDTFSLEATNALLIDLRTTMGELRNTIGNTQSTTAPLYGMNLFNYDVRAFNNTGTFDIYLVNSTSAEIIYSRIAGDTTTPAGMITGTVGALQLVNNGTAQGLVSLNGTTADTDVNAALFDTTIAAPSGGAPDANGIGLLFIHNTGGYYPTASDLTDPIAADFFSFGFTNDGLEGGERVASQIIRIEAEETGDNTGTFAGS